jgi:hypothetical protein
MSLQVNKWQTERPLGIIEQKIVQRVKITNARLALSIEKIIVHFQPNPMENKLIMSIEETSSNIQEVYIMDLNGNIIGYPTLNGSEQNSTNYTWTRTADAASGMYLIQIKSHKGITTERLILK